MRIATRRGQRTSSQGSPKVATWIFCLSAATLVWQFALYPLTLGLLTLLRPGTAVRRRPITPSLTVIIPAHNEEAVIERRVQNIWDCQFPQGKLEVIVVDDGSTDKTAQIVGQLAADHPTAPLKLVRQVERRGKAAAINAGMAQAAGDIIVVSDAPALFDRHSLERIVSNFADETVGAVSGTLRLSDDRTQTRELEGLFWRFKNHLSRLEGEVDSTSYMQGKLCSFRRELLERLDEDTLADDVNVALNIRARGYRVAVDREALCYQQKPSQLDELGMTKTRAAVGGIQESFRFRRMLFSPRYGLFGMMIFPTRVLYAPFSPFLVTAFVLSGASLALRLLRLRTLALVALASFATVSLAGTTKRSLRLPVLTFFFNQWVILRALLTWLLGKYDVRWEQARSVRAVRKTDGTIGWQE